MSGERVPLNDRAAAARQAMAEQMRAEGVQTLPDGATADVLQRRPGFVRKPFGSKEQKLSYPNRAGYHRHWFNDEPGRLIRASEAGYEQVRDKDGKPVSTVVGISRGGQPLTAYLHETPQEWHDEDMAAQDAAVEDLLGQIKRGDYERPTGRDGALRYAGSQRGDISITTSNRR